MPRAGELPHYPFGFRGDELADALRGFLADAPVTRVVTNGGWPAWLVTGYAAAREALKDPLLSRSRAADPAMPREEKDPPPLTVVGTMHLLRGAGLREEAVKGMGPRQPHVSLERVREIADTLLARMLARGEPADLVADFALPWAAEVTCELLGLPVRDAPELAGWFGLLATGRAMEEHLFDDWTKAMHHFEERMAVIGTDGLLGRLVALNRSSDRPLGHDDLVEIAVFLFLSGLGNPAAFLALCALVLARDHELAARLRREPEALPRALEELYRWSVMLGDSITRVAAAETVVGGVTVRAGELVLISTDAANRDPAVFDHPERLDIDRPPVPHLRFGRGRHFCPAAALNRAQTEEAVRALLDAVPGLRLAVAPDEIRWREDHAVLLPEAVPVRW
ncbi:cytochrome P450 [Streptomyces sp. NPDC004749]